MSSRRSGERPLATVAARPLAESGWPAKGGVMPVPSIATTTRRPWRLRSALAFVILALVAQVGWIDRGADAAVPPRTIILSPAQLDALTIPEIQDRFAAGQLSSTVLTLSYLARIRAVNDELHAVIAISPLALVEA